MAISAAAPTPSVAGTAELRRAIVGLAREAMTATLATIDAAGGHPYASLVEMATTADGRPLLLLSGLARHTRNLEADPRASLLVDRRQAAGALALERATFIGRGARTASVHDRQRFLHRHPASAGYADFADFGFWTIEPVSVHVIAGFGRIREVAASEVLLARRADRDDEGAQAAAAEASRVAAITAAMPGSPWTVSGIDEEGVDLVQAPPTAAARRIDLPAGIAADGDPATIAHLIVEQLTAAR